MSQETMKAFKAELKIQFTIIGFFVILFWAIEIINQAVFGDRLDSFGIIPRNIIGLRGILFAPFLHSDFGHLMANTIPFIILSWFVMLQRISDFFLVTICSILIGGTGVWLFAETNSVTIGASILVFGYLGFLLSRGFFQKNTPSIALSLLVFFLYGGMIWGVLPSNPHISWLGHLFGFFGGVLAAKILTQEKYKYSKDQS
jgi:membrane associated rhomboid family serine protease